MSENDKQTEERIFEAATEVFVEKGMDGARMQDIANRAGINKALLHYYYRSKDRLFNAVFEMIARKMLIRFEPVFNKDISLENKIKFFFKEHITFLQNNPRLPAFVLNEINRNPQRMKKFLKNIEISSFWDMIYQQHSDELKSYNINQENLSQVMISIAALSVFPFAARGILESIFTRTGIDFDNFLEKRKDFAAEFVIKALKKEKNNESL